jgi:hypothetical protein
MDPPIGCSSNWYRGLRLFYLTPLMLAVGYASVSHDTVPIHLVLHATVMDMPNVRAMSRFDPGKTWTRL